MVWYWRKDNAEIASQETGLVWGANQKHANRFGTVCTHMGVIQIQSGTWHLDIVGQIQGVEIAKVVGKAKKERSRFPADCPAGSF